MSFCQSCGTKLLQSGKYCHNCGLDLSQNGLSVPGGPSEQSTCTSSYDDFKKKKEMDRTSKFKKKNKKMPSQKNSTTEMAKVQVGIVSDANNTGHLKKVKGRTIPVLLNANTNAANLLSTSVDKHARHFKQFNKFREYVVLYPDMSVVQYLPGSCTPFTLETYKADLLKPYSKLYFWLCLKEEFENASCDSSESDDAALSQPSYPMGSNSAASAINQQPLQPTTTASNLRTKVTSWSSSATISTPSISSPSISSPPITSFLANKDISCHQCPTCFGHFPLGEIESHADACAEAWVDPIGECTVEMVSEEEDDEKEDKPNVVDPKHPRQPDLEEIKNAVSTLRSLCGGELHLTNRISIRRHSTFQDYVEARKKKWFKPKRLLKVTFVGEPATDDGGPKREFFTEILDHIRCTLFNHDGIPYPDMRALGSDEFKVVGELMACSIIQGGPAPSFLSTNVYDYIVDGIASVQTEWWVSLVRDDSLKQSIEMITDCHTEGQLRALLNEESMLDILQMAGYRGVPSKETLNSVPEITRSIVITGIARTLTIIDQMMTGLASFGVLDYVKSHKDVMQPLFTLEGARHFQPTSDQLLDGMNVEFSDEGSNLKAAEIDVYKHFCDYVQDLGVMEGGLSKLYKFITGSSSFTPLGLEKVITVKFIHWCLPGCKCRPTASTCDPSIRLPSHYRDTSSFEEAMTSALEEGFGFGLV